MKSLAFCRRSEIVDGFQWNSISYLRSQRTPAVIIGQAVAAARDNPIDAGIDRTSTTVLRGALRQEQTAWQCLVTTYSPVVYAWVRRAGLQPTDAADVVQDVMYSVAKSIGNYRREHEKDTFRGWLRRITQRRIADFQRRDYRQLAKSKGGSTAASLIAQHADEPARDDKSVIRDNGVIAAEQQSVIERVRNEFSTRNWLLFWRAAVGGEDTASLAKEFGVSPNVVRLAKSRVLRRLRELLAADATNDLQSE